MFGNNEIVGQKFFKDSKPGELFVTSVFFTLQGEGPYMGRPCAFVRLAKCNLACSFCDTYFDIGEWLSFDQIIERIDAAVTSFFAPNEVPLWAKAKNFGIVITGGEPSLQAENVEWFLELCSTGALGVNNADGSLTIFKTTKFLWSQVETNGIAYMQLLFSDKVVSPKCIEKGGVPVKYLTPNAETLEDARCLKFVVCHPDNERFKVYSEIPDWAHTWFEERPWERTVYVSPMNVYNTEPQNAIVMTRFGSGGTLEERSEKNERISFWTPGLLNLEENRKNHEWAAMLCMKHGYNLNMQMHLYCNLP